MSNSTSPKPNSAPKQGPVHDKELTFDKVVLRYSQPHHGDFLTSVMQKLQQPDATPGDLIFGISEDLDELERVENEKEEAKKAAEELIKNGKVAPLLLLNALSEAVKEMQREDKSPEKKSSSVDKQAKERDLKNDNSKGAGTRRSRKDDGIHPENSFGEQKASTRAERERQREILVKKADEGTL